MYVLTSSMVVYDANTPCYSPIIALWLLIRLVTSLSDGAETSFRGNQRYPCQRGWWNSSRFVSGAKSWSLLTASRSDIVWEFDQLPKRVDRRLQEQKAASGSQKENNSCSVNSQRICANIGALDSNWMWKWNCILRLTHLILLPVLRAQNIALIQIRLDILKTQDMGPLPSSQCQCETTCLEVQPLSAGSGNWGSQRAVSADQLV